LYTERKVFGIQEILQVIFIRKPQEIILIHIDS